MKMPAYPQISMQETGRHLHYLCHIAGYTARDLQMYCHLSNPQSVYKWFSGSTLPTVDNLYAISVLLGISMNDIIVCTDDDVVFLSRFSIDIPQPRSRRHVKYRIFPNQINKKAKGQKASLKKTGGAPYFGVVPSVFFVNIGKNIMRCIDESSEKFMLFCRVLTQEKTRSFQTGSWWQALTKKIFWLCSAYPFIFAAHPLSLRLRA